MAILGFEIEEISRVLALMASGQLEEIEWEEADRYLKVTGPRNAAPAESAPAAPPPVRTQSVPPPVARKQIAPPDPAPAPRDEVALTSPMVGVFYRAGKPGDAPFIEVGQRVVVDQVIGIIEAMKIFSEIPAEHSGVVVSIPAKDGSLVQAGSPLVILRRDS